MHWIIVHAVQPTVLRSRLREITNVNVTNELAKITLPVISLSANRDCFIPKSYTSIFQTNNPKMQVQQLSGPHFILQTEPKLAAIAIEAFVREIEMTQTSQ